MDERLLLLKALGVALQVAWDAAVREQRGRGIAGLSFRPARACSHPARVIGD